MEREIAELRQQLAGRDTNAAPVSQAQMLQSIPSTSQSPGIAQSPALSRQPSALDQYMGSHDAVASLLDLRSGFDIGSFQRGTGTHAMPMRRLEDVTLSSVQVLELFQQYAHRP